MRTSSDHFTYLWWCMLVAAAMVAPVKGDRGTYIVHMDRSAMPSPYTTPHSWYMSMLASLTSADTTEAEPTHVYTYEHVLDGFSAVLSESQLSQLKTMSGHVATYPETYGKADTTRSPEFLGLNKYKGLWPAAGFGEDMIIGVLDSGIWPESESFNDDGMPPVPERWRGGCETGTKFNSSHCNRKLIGGKSFSRGMKQGGANISKTEDYDSPRDYFGHGTHTSSTAAGNVVQSVDYFGYAKGLASGVANKARIAMYKVLFYNGTYDAAATDVLAGMDQAISDGVDVMSLSLGFYETPFDQNPIAIGAFAAMQKGIFVACSAGNDFHGFKVKNSAPWITTVAAGTIDRQFAAEVTLGEDELTLEGKSVFPESLFVSGSPLYFGSGNRSKEICASNTLDPDEVAGKFVFCDCNDQISVFESTSEMYFSGAAGGIFCWDVPTDFRPHEFTLPFVVLGTKEANRVKDYVTKSSNATVDMRFKITNLRTKPAAPQVADFSSRGPSIMSPWILKPDIMAPGVDILAAWVPNRPEVPLRDDNLVTDYALVSGTSMACPHISGIAVLIKSVHKDWSSAAIRSAMMTTADITDNTNHPIADMLTGETATPLDYGGGHVNPNKAMDPGLVYDINAHQYVNYLCALNYTSQQIKTITKGMNQTCENADLDLNYPSFILLLNQTNTTSYTFRRVLTNVADAVTSYRAAVASPVGMKVAVQPNIISFVGKLGTAEFTMTVEIDVGSNGSNEEAHPMSDYIGNFGYLSWVEINGTHVVRSSIVSVHMPLPH
ncbi:hypothetical protein QQ045_032429 [Rhodiola kirilowii]